MKGRRGMMGVVVVAVGLCAGSAIGQPPPDYDFQWARVGAAGNRAYDGPDPQGLVTGHGSVGYEYRISKLEITTGQWMEFLNTFSARLDRPPLSVMYAPTFWGATQDPTYSGPGVRYRLRTNVPDAGMLPVGGIDWRLAARFTNWLCNSKSPLLSALDNGAYDTSTFGYSSPGIFTDQPTHNPGAQFWIPTLDEWLKAVHYDPSATGANGEQGRWWLQPNRSDTVLVYGPPGQGQANSGFILPGGGEWAIPLGSYPDVTTPWGLLDAAGGSKEWTEGIWTYPVTHRTQRWIDGSYAGSDSDLGADFPYSGGVDNPEASSPWYSFRIASTVPAPSTCLAVFGCACSALFSRRREISHASSVLALARHPSGRPTNWSRNRGRGTELTRRTFRGPCH